MNKFTTGNYWQRLRRRVHQKTLQRLPLARKVQPGLRSIYVLPSRQGWMFLLLILIIWLLGTNYQNNLILAAAFMLISLHFISLFHVWRNISGLVFEAVSVEGVFVKERAAFIVRVSSKAPRHYRHLRLTLMCNPPQTYVVDIPAGGECRLQLEPLAQQRGHLPLPAIKVETGYPFGLVNCWTWIRLNMSAIVFPQPITAQAADSAPSRGGQKESLQAAGDDFYGFATYQPGSPLSRVAWKHYARGAGLHLKEFGGSEGSDLWIDWQSWQRLETESCLSAMCFQVLEQSKASATYGVRLPDRIVAPGSGEPHKLEVLTALALYGQSDSAATND